MTPAKRDELTHRFDILSEDLDYLVSIDEDRRIAFFEVPKAGCTSIKKCMIDEVNGYVGDIAPVDIHDRSISPLRMLSSYSDEEVSEILDPEGPYYRFCFVRNPYSRILSAYLDKIVGNEWERSRHLPNFGYEENEWPDFMDFLKRLARVPDFERDIHYRTQTRLTGRLGGLKMNDVYKFENFGENFRNFRHKIYGPEHDENYADFGMHHASNASDKIDEYYNDESRRIVRDIYASDFVAYGYLV